MPDTPRTELLWRKMLLGEAPALRRGRAVFKLLPSDPRCKLCNAPFRGIGSPLMRLIGKRPAKFNPRFCSFCERIAQKYPGGAEIELSFLFADVRGSTPLAERSSPTEFGRVISRFYDVATHVLIETDALIEKLVGDEVVGLYFPGFAGPTHAQQAILAAQRLIADIEQDHQGEPALPIGIGVHTGTAFAGIVGSRENYSDFTVLGSAVNVTARLASAARAGEVLISEAAYNASGLPLAGSEPRRMALKGHSEPVDVRAWRRSAAA